MFVVSAFAALLIEAAVGYPQALVRWIGHPVIWMGALIAWADRRWNRAGDAFATQRQCGVVLVIGLVIMMAVIGILLMFLVQRALPVSLATLAIGLIGSTLLAQRSLDAHVADVADAIERDGLDGGRGAVAMIVGRDPDHLDEAGVSRAAIESLAENFSDGVVAPLFWFAVAGLPGILIYKTINTADSMIGHLSERHRAFGWAAARFDDLINLPASRLSSLWFVLAACLIPDASADGAWRAVWRDARKHRSPNAGWPEAAMAGALGLQLAGPRVYHGEMVADAWMGEGRIEATTTDIRRALLLFRVACMIEALVIAIPAITL